jgi:hypothetical protein
MSDLDDLKARVDMLERIVMAQCSGQPFTVTLDTLGRPQMFTESLGPLPSIAWSVNSRTTLALDPAALTVRVSKKARTK